MGEGGEMAPQLKSLATLEEGPESSIQHPYQVAYNHL